MLFTTIIDPSTVVERKARSLADEFSSSFVPRRRRALQQIMNKDQDAQVWIVGEQELRYMHGSHPMMFFHPSMSMIRVKRLLAGDHDVMLSAAFVEPGDVVIDCTMGLASDAIVFSAAVGDKGKVIAIESEFVPYLLAREGLQQYICGLPQLEAAMRRIIPIHRNHEEYLKLQPDKSVDVVYFDPMFRRSVASSAIEPLRELANEAALRLEAVEQAMRVARKSIVMKERSRSGEFERLGFKPIHESKGKITYGVIQL